MSKNDSSHLNECEVLMQDRQFLFRFFVHGSGDDDYDSVCTLNRKELDIVSDVKGN